MTHTQTALRTADRQEANASTVGQDDSTSSARSVVLIDDALVLPVRDDEHGEQIVRALDAVQRRLDAEQPHSEAA
jgi:hypothetical protein